MYALEKGDKEFQLLDIVSRKKKLDNSCTQTTLALIRSYLMALLKTKPLSNKLLANVSLIRYKRSEIEIDTTNLDEVS